MSFEPIRRIVAKSLSDPRRTRDLQIARVFETARVVLLRLWGEERAAYVTPLSFREGVLKLETTSPSAKQQLALDLPRLKNEMNRQLGGQIVKTIQVRSKGF